jgi:predicted O-methyltransferase YrrM
VPDAVGTTDRAERSADEAIDRAFLEALGAGPPALSSYADEVAASGLVEHLDEQAALFWSTVSGVTPRGQRYNTGRVTGRDGYGEGLRLYALLRTLRPETVVETGVCNGVSTAFLLLALNRNGTGALHSIDLPEYADPDADADAFWEGKGGAVVPSGKEPGWMIPDELRGPWKLVLGRSQDELPPLLERLGTIDVFMHDSEHSYECMSFEFEHAFRALRPGGALIADDVDANDAFADFAQAHRVPTTPLGPKIAFLLK